VRNLFGVGGDGFVHRNRVSDWGVGMRFFQGVRSADSDEGALEIQGLAGWLLSLTRSWRGRAVSQQRQLQLVEALALGGRRQLMLVRCAGETFLVGGSYESVETIVRLGSAQVVDGTDEPCR
jgi:hypothetical protein